MIGMRELQLTSVHACGWSTFAVDDAGKVWSWGLNNYQQLGVGRKAKKVITTEFNPKPAKMFKVPIAQIAGGILACARSCAVASANPRTHPKRERREITGRRLVGSCGLPCAAEGGGGCAV